ncbi:enoyl-CoA hydratase [Shouchella shacheensis]|uniref:enoyl-CoA hydratase n=1 Tax=Shouchella shacheensis TaxID=1649580 RepID=UPI0007403D06|nr:enoyl-CoA hydratase [Shouchella shacheensis]
MSYTLWSLEKGVARITLNRPPANALARDVLQELDEHFDRVYEDETIRSVLIRGEGRFFAAGADIKEFTQVENTEEFKSLATGGQKTFSNIENCPKPVIAAIHGAALGGGLELAMACHIRLATEDTKLGLPELNLGLIPGFGGTQRLPKLVGKAKALELMLTSEPMTGAEGHALGLINSLHPEQSLQDEAEKLARKIAQKSPLTTKCVLDLLRYSDGPLEEGLKQEANKFGEVFDTEDRKEGVQAFIDKRKPTFQGK